MFSFNHIIDAAMQLYHWCCHIMISLMQSFNDIIGCCHSMISLMQSHNHCKGYYSRILWDIVIDAKIQWYHGTMISLMLSYHDIIDAIIQWYHWCCQWYYEICQYFYLCCIFMMLFNDVIDAYMMLTFNDIIDDVIYWYHWCCYSMLSFNDIIRYFHSTISLMLSFNDIMRYCQYADINTVIQLYH